METPNVKIYSESELKIKLKEQREICARVIKRQKNINGIKGLIGKDESANAIINAPEPK